MTPSKNDAFSRAALGTRFSRLSTVGVLCILVNCSSNQSEPSQSIMSQSLKTEVFEKDPTGNARFIRGNLGQIAIEKVNAPLSDDGLRPVLSEALAPFGLALSEVKRVRTRFDSKGNVHLRLARVLDGLPVVGGELMLHFDSKGKLFAINGASRGQSVTSTASELSDAQARTRISSDSRWANMAIGSARRVYVLTTAGQLRRAFEMRVQGQRAGTPIRDAVYVDVNSGEIVAVHPHVYFAQNRSVYTASNGTSLPGILKRFEGGAVSADLDVEAAYNNTGIFYQALQNFWGRDSYDGLGAPLKSTVHYSTNYCNLFWDGTQMVFGDGYSAGGCLPTARALDMTAHELTHAVTEVESGLIYSGESGALNESMSDIMGAFVDAFSDGGQTGTLTVSNDTWTVGEDYLPPALRYMSDPAADGSSTDYYSSLVGNLDVHYSSGIGNLAFYLLSQGGTHPRGKSTIAVTGIGIEKAVRLFYEINTNVLTPSSNYLDARNASLLAASTLQFTQAETEAVQNAWAAVGVGTNIGSGNPTDGGVTILKAGSPVSNLSGSTDSETHFSFDVSAGSPIGNFKITGGTGDADLYVRFGATPTLTTYDCRPFVLGNEETCSLNFGAAGTYHVMLRGYSAFSGVTLLANRRAPPVPVTQSLISGIPVTNLAGQNASSSYFKITTPAGLTLTVTTRGGTGDADLYVRFGSDPTLTYYDCRPYLSGNDETCILSNTRAGDYHIMINGYSAYSGVTLTGSYR